MPCAAPTLPFGQFHSQLQFHVPVHLSSTSLVVSFVKASDYQCSSLSTQLHRLEIRNEIYQLVFANLEAIGSCDLQLLQTCRQIYHEANNVAWSESSFKISHSTLAGLKTGLAIIGKPRAGNIKAVDLPQVLVESVSSFALHLQMLKGGLFPRNITIHLCKPDRDYPFMVQPAYRIFNFVYRHSSIRKVHLLTFQPPSNAVATMREVSLDAIKAQHRCFGVIKDNSMVFEFRYPEFESESGRIITCHMEGEPQWASELLAEVAAQWGFTDQPLW